MDISLILVVLGFLAAVTARTAPSFGLNNTPMNEAAVVGGSDAARGEFPYILSLQRIIVEGYAIHICGATIYSENWAISAAHCVRYLPIGEQYLKVVAGEHALQYFEGSEQSIGVVQAVFHDDFDPSTYENDIVLLKLKESLRFGQYVVPVGVPPVGYVPQGQCILSGWGSTSEDIKSNSQQIASQSGHLSEANHYKTLHMTRGFESVHQDIQPNTLEKVLGWESPSNNLQSNILQKVNLPIVSDIACRSYYSDTDLDIKYDMLCAGYEGGGSDACSRDDGGPLVCYLDGYLVLTGIASFGIGCAQPYRPGVYTEVSYYNTWIKKITGN